VAVQSYVKRCSSRLNVYMLTVITANTMKVLLVR